MRIPAALLFPFTHWNWKAAAIAAVLRAFACAAALRNVDPHARRHFGIVEAVFVLLTSGFFSALQQQSLSVKSRCLGWMLCVITIPLASLSADSLLHLWLDSGNMRTLGACALIFTLVSAMFHWHVMQNGALLVGHGSRSFWTDLKQMPRLAASFVTIPLALLRQESDTAIQVEEAA